METTATTLRWALLFMAHYPEVQQRVRNEIHEKIGDERQPRLSDRSQLRYTDAVLSEVQRVASIVPTGVPHRALVSCKVRNYDIPANAIVITNLYAAHRDPSIWKAPNRFDPEANFIHHDEKGEIELVNTEFLVPFGVGKRLCLGESLAKQELWIFFVGLLQKFNVKAHPEYPLPKLDELSSEGLVRAPVRYRITFDN